jgi:hypothetical protein
MSCYIWTDVMWWPFIVPPPAPFGASSTYFSSASNNDMVSRFKIAFETLD